MRAFGISAALCIATISDGYGFAALAQQHDASAAVELQQAKPEKKEAPEWISVALSLASDGSDAIQKSAASSIATLNYPTSGGLSAYTNYARSSRELQLTSPIAGFARYGFGGLSAGVSAYSTITDCSASRDVKCFSAAGSTASSLLMLGNERVGMYGGGMELVSTTAKGSIYCYHGEGFSCVQAAIDIGGSAIYFAGPEGPLLSSSYKVGRAIGGLANDGITDLLGKPLGDWAYDRLYGQESPPPLSSLSSPAVDGNSKIILDQIDAMTSAAISKSVDISSASGESGAALSSLQETASAQITSANERLEAVGAQSSAAIAVTTDSIVQAFANLSTTATTPIRRAPPAARATVIRGTGCSECARGAAIGH